MAHLGPKPGYIFRITHIRNVAWILQHGLHCKNSATADPNFISIGSPSLIAKRSDHPVPVPPGGTLADYVPFYFTSHSKMLYNITTGWEGITQRPNSDIAILVSSIDQLSACGVRYLFTTGHAYMHESDYCTDRADLAKIDWPLLNSRNFKNDPNDPGKSGRYQAEALVHQHVPVNALLGIACYDQPSVDGVVTDATRLGVQIKVLSQPQRYF